MATKYAQASGNFSAGGAGGIWYDAASGGSVVSKPVDGDDARVCAGVIVDLDEDVQCDSIAPNGAVTGQIRMPSGGVTRTIGAAGNTTQLSSSYAGAFLVWTDGSGTLVLNGSIVYSGSSTSGMITVGTGQTLTVQNTGGAGTTSVLCSGTGYAIVTSGSGTLTISNSGGNAVSSTGTGNCRAVSHGSTGSLSVTGNVHCTGGVTMGLGANSSNTINGDFIGTGTVCIHSNGTTLWNGTCGDTGSRYISITLTGGTLTWIGNRVMASTAGFMMTQAGGTFALANATGALNLANSGRIAWTGVGGTVTTSASGNTAAIVNQTTDAQFVCLAKTVSHTGPLIPAEEDVESGVEYGYAGDLQTGTLVGGGGYTYGDNDASQVLTTATGAGTYQPVAAADVQAGVAVGVAPAVGTFAVPTESIVKSGETYGNSAEFTGTYDPITGNYTDPGKANVLTGNDYYFGGVLQTAEYSPDFPAAAAVLDSDTVNGSPGTYHAPDAAEVISTAVFGPSSGTAGTYDVSNVAAGNIKKDVSIGGVTGTYDPMAAAVFPAAANVSTVETAYGPTGAEYAGALDVAALEAAAYSSGYDAGAIDGAATQYATDAAAVDAVKAGIRTTVTVLGVTGTLDLSLYCLIAGITWPALDEVDGGVAFGPVTGTEYEGTGVNATTLGTILDARGITTANKAQTGDTYIRLGAPAGASIAADIATVDTVVDAIKAKTDNLPASPAAVGSAMTLTEAYDAAKTAAPTAGEVADAVLDEILAEHAVPGSVGQALSAAGGAADPLLNEVPGAYAEGTAGHVIGTNLDAKVSEAGGGSVTILPLQSTAGNTGRLSPIYLTAYQHCQIEATILVVDHEGNAVDLTGKTLSLVAWDADAPTVAVFELRSDGASPELTIGGASSNQVTIDGSDTHTATARELQWRLYNVTDDRALASGKLTIVEGAVGPVPT